MIMKEQLKLINAKEWKKPLDKELFVVIRPTLRYYDNEISSGGLVERNDVHV